MTLKVGDKVIRREVTNYGTREHEGTVITVKRKYATVAFEESYLQVRQYDKETGAEIRFKYSVGRVTYVRTAAAWRLHESSTRGWPTERLEGFIALFENTEETSA